MSEQWGPWIEHDGRPATNLVGYWVMVEVEYGGGFRETSECRVLHGNGGSWTWSPGFTRAIRYRIRKPRGLTMMEDLIADIPQPVAPKVDA